MIRHHLILDLFHEVGFLCGSVGIFLPLRCSDFTGCWCRYICIHCAELGVGSSHLVISVLQIWETFPSYLWSSIFLSSFSWTPLCVLDNLERLSNFLISSLYFLILYILVLLSGRFLLLYFILFYFNFKFLTYLFGYSLNSHFWSILLFSSWM